MAQLTKDEITAAWRALSGASTKEGWRSIPISGNGFDLLRAGRQFPGNQEALLISFASITLPQPNFFPEGKGFKIEKVTLGDSKQWLALVRQNQGSLDLFSRMVVDIISTLTANSKCSPSQLFLVFLSRIKAWQEFMKKEHEGLGPEAELGLVGELDFLSSLLDQELPFYLAVDAWKGPFDALQDFELGHGAVEIKSTLAPVGFIASVMSLEQLNDNVRQPLFVCGSRFSIDAGGLNLSMQIAALREKLSSDTTALARFNSALLHAGYFDEHKENYTRTFTHCCTTIFLVDESFPRLTSGNTPQGIRNAKYDIDLDKVQSPQFSIIDVIKSVGVF